VRVEAVLIPIDLHNDTGAPAFEIDDVVGNW
jgi:hypothetical protein